MQRSQPAARSCTNTACAEQEKQRLGLWHDKAGCEQHFTPRVCHFGVVMPLWDGVCGTGSPGEPLGAARLCHPPGQRERRCVLCSRRALW